MGCSGKIRGISASHQVFLREGMQKKGYKQVLIDNYPLLCVFREKVIESIIFLYTFVEFPKCIETFHQTVILKL